MIKILLIKTSSLGDIVHNLPVVSDLRQRFPEVAVDWVVEEAYLPLARLHAGVRRAIPVAIRRWRKQPLEARTWREIGAFRRALRSEHYDAVIDTQGLFKSALLARVAQGRRHGFDAASAREPIAARFYNVVHHVARAQHAVVRNRELVAAALGYRVQEGVDYGVRGIAAKDSSPQGHGGEIVLLHSSARAEKLWEEGAWIALGRMLEARGLRLVLPWGNETELARSRRIAGALQEAHVPMALSMAEMTRLLSRARAVVGVDTGLVHLAAALGTSVAAIYCATDPRLYGSAHARNLGGPGTHPKPQEVIDALSESGVL